MLIPILKAICSIASRLLDAMSDDLEIGKMAFVKVKPGRNKMKIRPNTFLAKNHGFALSERPKNRMTVVTSNTIVSQYQTASSVLR